MGYRALTHVMQGSAPPVEPGEPIPETYKDVLGDEHPVDFERLVELGAAEEDTPATKRKSKAAAKGEGEQGEDSEPGDSGEE